MQYVEDMIIEHDLADIWRIRNPTDTRFTWRQKSPLIQRRLDYWLIGNCEEELPKKPVGRLSVNCRPTVDRQVTDSLPTANQQVTDRLRKKKNCGKNEQLTLT